MSTTRSENCLCSRDQQLWSHSSGLQWEHTQQALNEVQVEDLPKGFFCQMFTANSNYMFGPTRPSLPKAALGPKNVIFHVWAAKGHYVKAHSFSCPSNHFVTNSYGSTGGKPCHMYRLCPMAPWPSHQALTNEHLPLPGSRVGPR